MTDRDQWALSGIEVGMSLADVSELRQRGENNAIITAPVASFRLKIVIKTLLMSCLLYLSVG